MRGFTLIELLVVISIIAVLSAISISTFATLQKNSRDAKRKSDLKVIQTSLEQYKADGRYYPATSWLVIGTTGPIAGYGKTYLARIPTDPGSTQYLYQGLPSTCDNTGSNLCLSYCIYAQLDNTPPANDQSNWYGISPCLTSGYNYAVRAP